MSRPLSPRSITPDLLLRAYAAGLFPMAESADDPTLFWVDPDERGIFPLNDIVVSRSLRKAVRSNRFTIRFDSDFDGVIDGCAAQGTGRMQTWINSTIRRLYGTLFTRGMVHTVEAWQGEELVGGLYGVAVGGAFFGESMFHRATDASKVCLVHLAAALIEGGYALLDAQFVTPHLATLGALEIPRVAYHNLLAEALKREACFPARLEQGLDGGAVALATLERARTYFPAGSLPPYCPP